MADGPISMTLSPFEKLQILREEVADRKSDLTKLESDIRDRLFQIERQKYLESMSPFYAAIPHKT